MKITQTIVKDIDLNDILKGVLSNSTSFNSKNKKIKYMTMLSSILKKYRYELLNTSQDFQIITDGDGTFKLLRFGDGDELRHSTLFYKIRKLEKNQGIELDLI